VAGAAKGFATRVELTAAEREKARHFCTTFLCRLPLRYGPRLIRPSRFQKLARYQFRGWSTQLGKGVHGQVASPGADQAESEHESGEYGLSHLDPHFILEVKFGVPTVPHC